MVGPRRWAAVVVGFVGAMRVIRPGMEGTHWAVSYIVAVPRAASCIRFLPDVAGQDDAATSASIQCVRHARSYAFAFFEWSKPQTTLDWVIFASRSLAAVDTIALPKPTSMGLPP